jgi:hypothetical protein
MDCRSWPGRVAASDLIAKPKQNPLRYRGFVLLPQEDLSWLVRPERSPMSVLPFRAPACSIADVKALVDWRLARLERCKKPQLRLVEPESQLRSA